ncbi:MAG: glycoside hydrolase family 27 protein [Prolixibacteraceae bacterium]|jgi:alpha-galactosidase|nr:glycoside hydrolase family 27 protein [Prolixibacteraceae bacterium]
MRHIGLTILAALLFLAAGAQKAPKLAQTPPMGWNSWNIYACDINEKLVKEVAKAMVDRGLKDAGYEYVVIDDCWHGERDSLGFISADPEKFPSGIKALADYVHSLGLKFGIYSDAGWETCGGHPGSRGHEYQDAMKYAEWGVDYLKYDWCNTEGLAAEGAYLTMREALAASGRPILLSICEWGDNDPWLWAQDIGHMWRTTGDIYDEFYGELDHGTWSSWGILNILDMQEGLREYAGPGHWNDPDMMEVGNAMSVNEDRAHFSMWCMIAAPLIAGTDIQNATEEAVEILTNEEAIAVNQDKLGIQGFKHSAADSLEIWYKPLADGDWAVCFLNRDAADKEVNYNWKEIDVVDDFANRETKFNKNEYEIRDLWKHKNLGTTEKTLNAVVPSHDVLMLRLSMK